MDYTAKNFVLDIGAKAMNKAWEHNAGAESSDRDMREAYRDGFKDGAVYTRGRFAAQEPSDAEQGYAAMDTLGCELRVAENGWTTCDLHGGYATENDVCEVVATTLSAARTARQEWR